MVEWGFIRTQIQYNEQKSAIFAISDNFQHLASIEHIRIPNKYRYMMEILSRAITYINIYLVVSCAQYKPSIGSNYMYCQNAENDIFLHVSSCLMSIFSSNVGHQENLISKS